MYSDEHVLKSVDEYLRQLKRKRMIKTTVFLIFLVVILALLFLLYSPFFNIKTIDVYGNSRYEDEYIIGLTQIKVNQNILKIEDKKIIKKLESEPYIEKAKIIRNFPDRITIEVTERKPIATTFFNGQYLLISKEGRVLENVSTVDGHYPHIRGLEISESKDFAELINTIIEEDGSSRLKVALMILELADSSTYKKDGVDTKNINKIDYIDVTDLNNIELSINNRINVNFGRASEFKTETILYRFQLLEAIENDLGDQGADIEMTEGTISNKKANVVPK